MSMTLKELADACNARIQGGDSSVLIDAVADIGSAATGQVTQLISGRYAKYIKGSAASACFVAEDFAVADVPQSMALLITKDPELSFIQAIGLLHPERAYLPGIAPQAVLGNDVSLGGGVFVGPYAVIGGQACIGDGTAILAGSYIGSRVKIGKNCRIYPYAVIYDDVVIGDNVIIHSGAIIGADGFGYKFRDNQHVKVPQVGNVIIEDNVEIGANTCVDRGALGSTTLGSGSKIDNLVQIGHNNKIGRHVIMCGQVGVSGSCKIDDYAILAGSAGVADHVNIGQGAVVMARAGVAGDVPAKTQVFGSPAKDKRVAYKEQVALAKLPELLKKVKWLEERLQDLEKSDRDAGS
ncbi:MAG: UDP-3-O-(3-hydroxymyristoyl)glucosamine N-acyltransferase [Methylovulum miyakonense]|uniref:UDP-3-O-(3-hydroxymyristoyl)glucosamine N-acyltransferase n=1 Tax=Methylovulum miyakonense TaxID=645578 RepID=UPI003BB7DA1F